MSDTNAETRGDAAPMATVGVIKPTRTSQSFAHLRRLMPGEIALEPRYLDIRHYSVEEFQRVLAAYETLVAELAAHGVDLIHPEGAPPFMLEGYAAERARVAEWERRFAMPVFTTGMTQLAAMRALGIERFVGLSPFTGALADAFARYFTDAGHTALAMTSPTGDSGGVYGVPPESVPGLVVEAFERHAGRAQALYILGSNWPVFDAIEEIEATIGVPVLHPVAVRCWYILRRLGHRGAVARRGRLLAEMPALPEGAESHGREGGAGIAEIDDY